MPGAHNAAQGLVNELQMANRLDPKKSPWAPKSVQELKSPAFLKQIGEPEWYQPFVKVAEHFAPSDPWLRQVVQKPGNFYPPRNRALTPEQLAQFDANLRGF